MIIVHLTFHEIKRLFHSKRTWLFIAAFIMAPVLLSTDLFGLGNNYFGTMSNVFMLLPAKSAVFIGVITAAFLTLLEMQRMTKYRMDAIVETAVNPLTNYLRQTAAIVFVATVSAFASICLVLPYTMIVMGSSFKILPFMASWVYLYFGGIILSVLLSSGIFMITRSLDASLIMIGVLIAISLFSSPTNSFLVFWVQTNVFSFSDATESILQVDVILYTRLVGLLAASAVYILGLACVRRYGKNLLETLLLSVRKVLLPALTILLSVGCLYAVSHEPFFDNGPVIKYERAVDPETGIVIYNINDNSFKVDNSRNNTVSFINGKAHMLVDTNKRSISGEATYTVRNPSGKEQDVSFSISPGLNFLEVYENDVKIPFTKNKSDNFMQSVYHLKLTADKAATLRIIYEGSPKNSTNDQMRKTGITDQFVFIHYTYPMPNTKSVNSRMYCTLSLPENLTPIMENTELTEVASDKTGYKTYEYRVDLPHWLFAGEYNIEKISAGSQEIQFIYLKGREKAIRDSGAISVVADVVDFFTEKFGPLNFNGKPLIIAELDASFVTGGWGLGNMSVFGESMFAGTAYKSRAESANLEGGSGIGVAVHEIAHQWWGWSPDSVFIAEDGKSPWSGEGLTVYSTYLYLKERYGEAYAKREFVDAWTKKTNKMQNAFFLTHLEYASKLPQNDAVDIYTAFASTTRYEMMPYLLLKAEKLCGGEEVFLSLLMNISQKYRRQELSYDAFLRELGLTKEEMQID